MERNNGLDVYPQKQEDIFQSAFTYATFGMAIVALDGHWLDVNPSLCELIGYSKEELLQMTFQDITHPDDLSADLAFVHQLIVGKLHSYKMEKRYFHKSGDIIWVLLCVSLTRDSNGQPLYFISQIADITERKQTMDDLRQNEERYEMLFNSIDDGFCVVEILFDDQGKPKDYLFLEMNPAFTSHNQLGRISVGKTILELYPDIENWWIDTYGRVALTGEPVRFEREFKNIGHWFDVYAFRFGSPESRKVAIMFNDITERKLTGFKVEQMQKSLDDRVRQLESALSEVKRLQGILPICSYCKDIRDDENFWVQVEDYITNHSEAMFSHSICPNCYNKAIAEIRPLKKAIAEIRPLK
jgi:PAS domain S-box-containing protein